MGARDWAMTRPTTPTTQQSNDATRSRGRRDTADSPCARGLAGGGCHDTKFCIVTGDRGLVAGGCVTIQSLYHDRQEVWLAKRVTIQMIVM